MHRRGCCGFALGVGFLDISSFLPSPDKAGTNIGTHRRIVAARFAQSWGEQMKTGKKLLLKAFQLPIGIAILIFIAGFVLNASAATIKAGCTYTGGRFNLEPLNNPPGGVGQLVATQFDESIAVLPGRGMNGVDLVLGAAIDEWPLPPLGFDGGVPADAFYIERANSNCTPDSEGALPPISGFESAGNPMVIADPAHDAFFAADLRFGVFSAVGLLKAAVSTLLNGSNCPNGIQQNPVTCWDSAQLIGIDEANIFLFNPAVAVDQRTSGQGAGDVYVVVTQEQNDARQIFLTACTNSLSSCGSSVLVSGQDQNASFPWVQVRPDGGITISYLQNTGLNSAPVEIRFVNCTPGSPPACSAPIPVLTENQPMTVTFPGDEWSIDDTYPRHIDRLESDGKTITTFLLYDRCEVPVQQSPGSVPFFCPKTDVVVTSSSDGGNTWSPLQKVSSADGQQFYGAIALDASTGTVNMAYYSTEADPLKLRMQIFLNQILPGQTSVGTPKRVTSIPFDGVIIGRPIPSNGNIYSYIGMTAAGTGKPGQSSVYVHFTSAAAFGLFNSVPFPVTSNVVASFQY